MVIRLATTTAAQARGKTALARAQRVLDYLIAELTVRLPVPGGIYALAIYNETDDGVHYSLQPADDISNQGDACVDDLCRALILACELHRETGDPKAARAARRWATFLRHVELRERPGVYVPFTFGDGRLNIGGYNSRPPGKWAQGNVARAFAHLWAALGDEVYGEKFWEVVRVATPDLKAVANRVEGDLTAYETCLAAADDKGAGDLESRIRHDVERIIGNCLPAGYFADYRRGAEPRRLRETVQLWGYHQPLAVARAARLFAEPAWLAACVRTVETLIDPLLDKVFPIVPHAWPVDGLGHPLAWPDEPVRWSGTAYHVSSLVAGLTELYLATGDRSYGERAIRIADWLLGENPAGESMYHPILGGCYDGMTDGAINRNLGAESSIEAGRAELFRYRCEHALAESDGEADAAPSDRRRANQGLTAGEAHAAG